MIVTLDVYLLIVKFCGDTETMFWYCFCSSPAKIVSIPAKIAYNNAYTFMSDYINYNKLLH